MQFSKGFENFHSQASEAFKDFGLDFAQFEICYDEPLVTIGDVKEPTSNNITMVDKPKDADNQKGTDDFSNAQV